MVCLNGTRNPTELADSRPAPRARQPFPTLRQAGRCVLPQWSWAIAVCARPAPSWARAGTWPSFRIFG